MEWHFDKDALVNNKGIGESLKIMSDIKQMKSNKPRINWEQVPKKDKSTKHK